MYTVCASLPAQQPAPKAFTSQPILERRFKAAQAFQAANDLDHAAQQYRIFIADSLGQLALGHARAGDIDTASSEFDEALHLVPDFPTLRLEYARVSLEGGHAEHAQILASAVLQQHLADPKLTAKAHILLGRALLKLGKNEDAKREIEQAVALDSTFENGYELAVADLDLGDGDAATKIFSEMLDSFGDTAQIHLLFGQAYSGSDLQQEAVNEFKAAIAKDPKLPGAHYSLAAAFVATEGGAKLAEAEAELRKEIAISPDDSAAYAALGHLLANQNDREARDTEALKYLKQATVLDPKNPDTFLYLGQLYVNKKMPTEAEISLRNSIALTKDVSRNAYQVRKAHYLLGRVLIQSGRIDEGKLEITASQKLMQQNLSRDEDRLSDYLQTGPQSPASPNATEIHNPMVVEKDAEAARLTVEFEKQFGPAIADSYNNLGAIAGSENNFRQALEYFGRAAEWNPALPGLDVNWGRAAFAAGSPTEAIGPLSRYLQTNPEDEGARNVLGLSQFLAKDYCAARKTLASIVDKADETPQVRYAYAKSLVETNDLNDGIVRLLALEKADLSIADVHAALGKAYALQNSGGAIAELTTAIQLNPLDAEAHTVLGRVLLKQGNNKEALLNLEAAARLDQNNPALREELAQARLKAQHE